MKRGMNPAVAFLTPEQRKLRLKTKLKSNLISYIFLTPFIVGALVFTAYPLISSLWYSFTDYNGAYAYNFGIFNYASIFTEEAGAVFTSFGLTFAFTISSTVINLVLSYILALFLHNNMPGIRIIRVLCYLPCLIPGLASGFIWRDILSYAAPIPNRPYEGLGIINVWLKKMGLPVATFFGSAQTSMLSLLFTGLWGLGGGMIMWLAAFDNISPDLYEAAKIDGANYFHSLFKITLPLSTPILFYNMVVTIIAGLQVFGTYAAYGVGEGSSLYFIAIYIYREAFEIHQYRGYASAVAWLLFAVIAALTLVMFKLNNWVHYGDD